MKPWYVYTMKYYSAVKIIKFEGKLKNLEIIIFNEVTQTHKDELYVFCLVCVS